jgi:hypothetical protein
LRVDDDQVRFHILCLSTVTATVMCIFVYE